MKLGVLGLWLRAGTSPLSSLYKYFCLFYNTGFLVRLLLSFHSLHYLSIDSLS